MADQRWARWGKRVGAVLGLLIALPAGIEGWLRLFKGSPMSAVWITSWLQALSVPIGLGILLAIWFNTRPADRWRRPWSVRERLDLLPGQLVWELFRLWQDGQGELNPFDPNVQALVGAGLVKKKLDLSFRLAVYVVPPRVQRELQRMYPDGEFH